MKEKTAQHFFTFHKRKKRSEKKKKKKKNQTNNSAVLYKAASIRQIGRRMINGYTTE